MNILILGTKSPSPYGRWAAHEIAMRLAKAGAAICVLSEKGISLSVINAVGGNYPINVFCTEDSDAKLLEALPETENIRITECKSAADALKFADGVVLVEASVKEAATALAEEALNDKKPLFCLCGNINQAGARGPYYLIGMGAKAISSLDSIAGEIMSALPRESPMPKKIYQVHIGARYTADIPVCAASMAEAKELAQKSFELGDIPESEFEFAGDDYDVIGEIKELPKDGRVLTLSGWEAAESAIK